MKLFRKLIPNILIVCASALSLSSFAATVQNLTSAQVSVKDRSQSAWQTGVKQAFDQVLIKVSGNPGIVTLPLIQNNVSNVAKLVQSYSYGAGQDINGNPNTNLQVIFDPSVIKKLLQKAGQTIWNEDRPETLTIVQVQPQTGPHYLLSSDANDPLSLAVMQDATRRGLPMMMPEMDLQDQTIVNPDSPFPLNQTQITALQNRYAVNDVLLGKIQQTGANQWQAQWVLYFNGAPYSWKLSSEQPVQMIATGIDNVANTMATQLAVLQDAGSTGQVTVEIKGIHNLKSYAKISKYLNNLTPVNNVDVLDLGNNYVLLKLDTTASATSLSDLIGRDHKLVPDTSYDEVSAQSSQVDLHLRLNS